MKMPIPNDWDGVTLCSYCVQWPDSTLWRIIFRGLISNPMLEAFWDKNTGDLAQVLADFEPTLDFNLDNLECGDMNIPVGTIMLYGATGAPDGFLLCDGSEISRTAYSELFSRISISYGAGDGSTTFNLPNLQGRVAVGRDPTDTAYFPMGKTGGEKEHTLTLTEMPSHTHVQNQHTHVQNQHTHVQDQHTHTQNAHNHSAFGAGSAIGAAGTARYVWTGADQLGVTVNNATPTNQNTTPTNQNTTPTNQNTTPTNQNAGGGGLHNNLQPYIILNYIIRTGLPVA